MEMQEYEDAYYQVQDDVAQDLPVDLDEDAYLD